MDVNIIIVSPSNTMNPLLLFFHNARFFRNRIEPLQDCMSETAQSSSDQNIVGNYRLDKCLGQGTYGKVRLAYRLDTNEKVRYTWSLILYWIKSV